MTFDLGTWNELNLIPNTYQVGRWDDIMSKIREGQREEGAFKKPVGAPGKRKFGSARDKG